MASLPIPSLAKCLHFMGVGQPHLQSFEGFKSWVIANHQSGYDIDAPGKTGWQYQVPFWTTNARRVSKAFSKYTHFVKNASAVDRATGLKIWHGYWCTGHPANGSYDTGTRDDIHGGKWKPSREEIHASTVGVKFYCLGDEQPQLLAGEWIDPKLVIITMSLRVEKDGSLYCLPVQVATNVRFVGGHGGGTFTDATHHCYTSRHGWDSREATNSWGHFSNVTDPEKKKKVQEYHDRIFDMLLVTLA